MHSDFMNPGSFGSRRNKHCKVGAMDMQRLPRTGVLCKKTFHFTVAQILRAGSIQPIYLTAQRFDLRLPCLRFLRKIGNIKCNVRRHRFGIVQNHAHHAVSHANIRYHL